MKNGKKNPQIIMISLIILDTILIHVLVYYYTDIEISCFSE